MGYEETAWMAGVAAALLLLAGLLHRRRHRRGPAVGAPWALLPWDYVMLLAGVCLIVSIVHLLALWRDGL
ncbi:LPXTG cell wall anchor domain-containing protein [Sandaracinobacteroides saxicola]|uniref:LPXTG cell wall anchor domain-containing protein n=1 Tax=Sandaracinobacteroides saxicola TaxID=2759707 RepID=A0A7G5IGV2_9SPHN|nr:LPXTG cell wall anchor domain-containing protein [Sandaracinobacteroides saxicola]QMW22594.1 LPXTG cell wall anchor domain-containing protein [Sandaracinobacteroides saxicola]